MNSIKNCKFCGKEFIAKTSRAEVCSHYCRSKLQTKKEREKRFKFLLENGVEGEDYIIDKWSGNPTTTLFGSYMQKLHPDKSIEDYKSDFPGAPLMCEKYKQQISVNSGKHMKLPK